MALADDEITVLGAGKTLVEAISKAKKKEGGDNPIMMRVPEKMITFVGSL